MICQNQIMKKETLDEKQKPQFIATAYYKFNIFDRKY